MLDIQVYISYKGIQKRQKQPKPHLEIQRFGNIYYGVIRATFRDKGKIKHTPHGTIKGKSYEELKMLQAAFRGDVMQKSSIVTAKEDT